MNAQKKDAETFVTIVFATYVQRRIRERRERSTPRRVPTHLEITGRKIVTIGVASNAVDTSYYNLIRKLNLRNRHYYALNHGVKTIDIVLFIYG